MFIATFMGQLRFYLRFIPLGCFIPICLTSLQLLLSKVDSAPTCLQTPLASSPAAPGAQPQVPTVVPCGLDTMMATAVHHSRAAAGEELMGNAAGAVDQYGKAADVLLFLLAAPQQQHHHWQQQQKEQSGGVVQDALVRGPPGKDVEMLEGF